jgi:hypothetical protein
MPTTKGETRGLPKEEEGLLDVEELRRLIKAARAMAVPALPNQKALAEAMTRAGRPTFERRAYDFEAGRVVPSAAELLLICAVTRPPGGLAHFAPAFPTLWSTLEADLVRTPRIAGVSVEPVRGFFVVCDVCGERSPVMDNVRYPGPRLDSMLREWTASHKGTHKGGEQ